ncbi:MAG: hypothetical protein HW407_2144 [Bacteroidetes bacterium]|nr:hypothetical protein [Bacteroidota bacterium]
MKSQPHVYLSGGMEYAENEGRDWRHALQTWIESELGLGWTVFNPNHESDRFFRTHYPGVDIRALKAKDPSKYKEIVERLVEIDCKEIAGRSDLRVCYWDESAMRGAGTKGEVTIARYFGKPVYMVTAISLQDIPGWVLACTTRILPTFSDLRSFLKSLEHNSSSPML